LEVHLIKTFLVLWNSMRKKVLIEDWF